jgi:transketolase
MSANQRMRDTFIEGVNAEMRRNEKIFFISADFGAPSLDRLRSEFPARFINCGIAEANLVNLSTGLALEGYTVFAYAIAPFITMRCYEQIRVNLALLSHIKPLRVNLVGVGAGYSYDVSGPSHQALEDISIMRTLPNITVLSPADSVCARQMAELLTQTRGPTYVRLDGKSLPSIYTASDNLALHIGFRHLHQGKNVCLIATGYMTHKALAVADLLAHESIDAGIIDLYNLSTPDENALYDEMKRYRAIVSLEEGFIGKGGMDSLLLNLLNQRASTIIYENIGIKNQYNFQVGHRDTMLRVNQADEQSVCNRLKSLLAHHLKS